MSLSTTSLSYLYTPSSFSTPSTLSDIQSRLHVNLNVYLLQYLMLQSILVSLLLLYSTFWFLFVVGIGYSAAFVLYYRRRPLVITFSSTASFRFRRITFASFATSLVLISAFLINLSTFLFDVVIGILFMVIHASFLTPPSNAGRINWLRRLRKDFGEKGEDDSYEDDEFANGVNDVENPGSKSNYFNSFTPYGESTSSPYLPANQFGQSTSVVNDSLKNEQAKFRAQFRANMRAKYLAKQN